jgi:FixJ family two-component response regulator
VPEMNIAGSEILVVDDEASLRDICQDALEDAGYKVYQAQNGQAALDFLAERNVDLVITDLRMPVLNGLELLKQIKTRDNDSAFLVMTGFGTIETAVESMKMGASDYLPKPFNINHLLLKVEKVLKERQIKAERKKLSNLVRMLNLSSALNSQLDLRSLINEFLFHLEKNFAPGAIGLFLTRSRRPGTRADRAQGHAPAGEPGDAGQHQRPLPQGPCRWAVHGRGQHGARHQAGRQRHPGRGRTTR